LGLDGRSYAPPALPTAAGEAGPSLGTLRAKTWGERPPAFPVHGPPAQLRLGLDEWDAIEPLTRWGRRRVAAALAERVGELTAKRAAAIEDGRQRPGGTQDNLAKCCYGMRQSSSTSPAMWRTPRGKIVWSGLVRCGDRCCPECGVNWAQATSHKVGCLIARWLGSDAGGLLDPDAWMLTLAPPHALSDAIGVSVDDLQTIYDRFVRCAAWRRFALRWGLAHEDDDGRYRKHAAVVPFLDAAFGGDNGAHVHYHTLLLVGGARVSGEERRSAALRASAGPRPEDDDVEAVIAWEHRAQRIEDDRLNALDPSSRWEAAPLRALDRHERAVLLDRIAADAGLWSALVEIIQDVKPRRVELFGKRKGELVPQWVARSALQLTPGEDAARYFTAWGLESELGASPLKGRSHLRLLDAAGAGVPLAGNTWKAWREAVRGRRWARGLGPAMKRLGIDDDDVSEWATAKQAERDERRARAAVEPLPVFAPVAIVVPHYLWGAAVVVGVDVVEHVACAAADAGEDAQAAVSALLWRYQTEANARARERPPPE